MKLATVAVLALAGGVAQQGHAQRAPDFAAFDSYVTKALRDWNGVGLGIAIVKGDSAAGWLASVGLPARLVAADGSILRLGGWPS